MNSGLTNHMFSWNDSTKSLVTFVLLVAASLAVPSICSAQDTTNEDSPTAEETVQDRAGQIIEDTREFGSELAEQVDESEQAHEVSAGVLNPIYQLAEVLAFPYFHWVAFALMVTGVVSYALQLVLAKLIVLSKLGFSLSEILSDALGLVISLVGLVLTTQAAAENSTFTQSPAMVLSATVVGGVCGFVFYLWGQSQELQAVEGRRRAPGGKEK